MKNLPQFLIELNRNGELLEDLGAHPRFLFIRGTALLFYREQVNLFNNEKLFELYTRGMTYKELEKVTGRPLQSIRVSLLRYTKAEHIKEHKENRKLWTQLMNYALYVHEADKAGTWDYLVQQFPHKTLQQLKQNYRLAGGTKLFQKRAMEVQQKAEEIRELYTAGIEVKTIAEELDIPMSTVYYHIKDLPETVHGNNDTE